MHISKKHGYLISSILLLLLILITVFIILLFMHPIVYFSKTSGFSQRDIVKSGKNKLRFVVPETVDVTKSTFISVKQEWFESSRIGKITTIKAKPNKYMAIDFTDRQYDSEVLTIYTKNWIGIKKEYDVIFDYSNFLRVFFSEPYTGEAPRKPVILPYSKLQTEYKHIYEELYKIKSFVPFNKEGIADRQSVGRADVFTKENARGRAFIVDNSTHISLVYDFLLKGIFKNQTQKTQIIDYIDKTAGKFTTYDPAKQGIDIKFNTAPFYISKFLGWYYFDLNGKRIDLAPGQEVQIPNWVTSELRLIARYDITTDTDKIGPELDKQGLVAVSYFDGAQRVYFDIVKKGSPLKEYFYQKEGYTYAGWYKDSTLTKKVDFTKELATTHTVLYLKSIKQNQPKPEKPVQYHNINFITPSNANQLFPTRRVHGQKLEINYLTPSLVSRLDEHGNLEELDYWNLVDLITGARTKYDFNTPITQDITLEAVMRKRAPLKTKYTIKRYFESVDQAGNFIEDKSKEEVVEGQTPGTEVELSPTQTNAPTGFTLTSGTVVKKKISKDGTTVFELRYTRNRYTINFEVNYKGNHFKDVNASATPEQIVPHEGKLTKPANPTITKAGYSYTFKHWQLKDEMGNVYKEVSEFDFNTKITKNLTLVAYFTEEKQTVNYTINHVFEGVDDIADKTEAKVHQALADSNKTISNADRLTEFDEHFTVNTADQTQQIKPDGTTVFTLEYKRKTYSVTYEVNFNGTQFSGVSVENQPQTAQVKYQGKINKPVVDPKLTKAGYNYNFVQWQDKAAMNGAYLQIVEFKFSDYRVTGNITLVAYFTENAKSVNYTINHVFEGVDDIAQKTEAKVHQALADSNKTISNADRLTEFDEHFTVNTADQTQQIKPDGTTVFTLEYKRKTYSVTYEVNFNGTQFSGVSVENQPQTAQVKYQGKINKPVVDPKLTKAGYNYNFVQWQDKAAMNGAYLQIVEFKFSDYRVTGNITLVAYFTENAKSVNYTINHVIEGVDDIAQKTEARVHQALADSSVTVSKAQRLPEYEEHFTVNTAGQTKQIKPDGTTVFTLEYKRKSYTVNYEVNYNGTQFSGVSVENQPQSTQVKYQGKVQKPAIDPKLTKTGYNYTFVQWQEKTAMNGTYSQIQEYDFANTRIVGNTTLVAYFTENAKSVNYTINHVIEGVDDIAQKTEARVHQALADSSVTVSKAQRLPEYEEHFTVEDQSQTQTIKPDGSTVFTLQYKRKSYTVSFEFNDTEDHFIGATLQTPKPGSQEIKYQGKVRIPNTPVLTKEGYDFRFVQWQDKALMNGTYSQVAGFNFGSDRVEGNLTLVAYFTKSPKRVKYTINHVFEGVDNIAERTDARVHEEFTDKELTISNQYRLTQYDRYFTVEKQSQTKTIKADGTTEFRLEYKRRLYTVNFTLNYRRKYSDIEETNKPETQTIKYEGKIKKPTEMPGISKHGYTFKFIQWQDNNSMNGYYNKVSSFDFDTYKVYKDVEVVAYFKVTYHYVNYKIVHYLEKRGPESTLDNQYERIEEIKQNQPVEKDAVYSDYKGPAYNIFEKETTNPNNRLTAKLEIDNHDTEVIQYYRLKEIEVFFDKTRGVEDLEYTRKKFKVTRRVLFPGYTLTKGYDYLGWSERNSNQVKDEYIAGTSNFVLYLKTTPKTVKITYNVKLENPDGSFEETKIYKSGKVGTTHYLDYTFDKTIYSRHEYTKGSIVLSANEDENQITITVYRNAYRGVFSYKSKLSDYYGNYEVEKYLKHGQRIGKIDDSSITKQGYEVLKLELNGKPATLSSVENYVVDKQFYVKIIYDLPSKLMYQYPQTDFYVNSSVKHYKDDYREIKFKANGKEYTTNVKRALYNDDDNNIYELFRGYYYKFEPVQFVKIPLTDFWTTREIIDFAPFNVHHESWPRVDIQHSLINAWVKDIGKIMGTEAFLPTYDDTGEFSLKSSHDSHKYYNYFYKKPTKYALKMIEYNIYYKFNSWHDHDFYFASENGKATGFYSNDYTRNYWWLPTFTLARILSN